MSYYTLDTNICIYLLNGKYPLLTQRFQLQDPNRIKISSMVEAELRLGAEKSMRRERVHAALDTFLDSFEVVSFDREAAHLYALIRSQLERQGMPIGPNDIVIAATAMLHGHILVTHNKAEFRRVLNLKVEDWVTDAS